MKANIIGLLSETSMHPGTEGSMGVVDLPVAREITTGYPVITGSSLKGAFKEGFEERGSKSDSDKIFGEQNRAGNLAITDGRILLLPVRTLVGHYKWVTCPYIISRFVRDIKLAGHKKEELEVPEFGQDTALYYKGKKSSTDKNIFLEEVAFSLKESGEFLIELAKLIKPLMYHESLKNRLLEQLVVINNDEFAYFAKYGLEIRARNKLNSETKSSENLWYEECLPADTLLYTLFLPRLGDKDLLEKVWGSFTERPYIQIGGNETIGQGWCVLSRWKEGEE